jgi:DNA-binding protein HU-beta
MAKAKAKKKAAKKKPARAKKPARKAAKPAKKAASGSAILKRPVGGKSYTKSALVAHLAEATSAQGFGDISKKQATAFLEELSDLLINFAPVGAAVPGIGKLLLRKTPKRPARMGRNPATGEEIKIKAKPAGKKLVFRISKAAKVSAGLVK